MPKRQLPTGFKIIFRRLLKEGMPAKEAMGEAWKRYKIQSKRHAIRQSFENPKKRFRAVEKAASFVYKGYRVNWHSRQLRYNIESPEGGYIGSTLSVEEAKKLIDGFALEDARTKNPRKIPWKKHPRLKAFVTRRRRRKRKNPIVDGTFTGIVSKNHRRMKRNPIAVYNPRGKILYGKILEIRGIKTNGAHRGKAFRHVFQTPVEAVGLNGGEVCLRSKHGLRLWDYEDNI